MIDGKMEERKNEGWEGRGKGISKKPEKKRKVEKVEKVEEMRGKFSESRSVKNIKSERPKILKK